FQAEDGIRDFHVTGVQTCALPISRAAFELGTMNDPLHHDPSTSLLAEPDAFQAFRWYSQALDGGVREAAGRLDALKRWADEQAAGGNAEAERLLLQWE